MSRFPTGAVRFSWRTPIRILNGEPKRGLIWLLVFFCACGAYISSKRATTWFEASVATYAVAAIVGIAATLLLASIWYVAARWLEVRSATQITFDDQGYFGRIGSIEFDHSYAALACFEITPMVVATKIVRPVVYLFPYGSHTNLSDDLSDERPWTSSYSSDIVHVEIGPEVDEKEFRDFLTMHSSALQ